MEQTAVSKSMDVAAAERIVALRRECSSLRVALSRAQFELAESERVRQSLLSSANDGVRQRAVEPSTQGAVERARLRRLRGAELLVERLEHVHAKTLQDLADALDRLKEKDKKLEEKNAEVAEMQASLRDAERRAEDAYVCYEATSLALSRLNERLTSQVIELAASRTELVHTERKLTYKVEDLENEIAALRERLGQA